jgi:hypothetical protein
MAGSLRKAEEDGIVARGEVEKWLEEQAMLHASGDFFSDVVFCVGEWNGLRIRLRSFPVMDRSIEERFLTSLDEYWHEMTSKSRPRVIS